MSETCRVNVVSSLASFSGDSLAWSNDFSN